MPLRNPASYRHFSRNSTNSAMNWLCPTTIFEVPRRSNFKLFWKKYLKWAWGFPLMLVVRSIIINYWLLKKLSQKIGLGILARIWKTARILSGIFISGVLKELRESHCRLTGKIIGRILENIIKNLVIWRSFCYGIRFSERMFGKFDGWKCILKRTLKCLEFFQ